MFPLGNRQSTFRRVRLRWPVGNRLAIPVYDSEAFDATVARRDREPRRTSRAPANVFVRGVFHILSPSARIEMARNLLPLVGTTGRVFLSETNFRGSSLEYLESLGATPLWVPEPLQRAIRDLPRPGHFGAARDRAATFPAADWDVLADGPSVIETIPLRGPSNRSHSGLLRGHGAARALTPESRGYSGNGSAPTGSRPAEISSMVTVTASACTSSNADQHQDLYRAGLRGRCAGQQDADERAGQRDQPDRAGLVQAGDQGQARGFAGDQADPVPPGHAERQGRLIGTALGGELLGRAAAGDRGRRHRPTDQDSGRRQDRDRLEGHDPADQDRADGGQQPGEDRRPPSTTIGGRSDPVMRCAEVPAATDTISSRKGRRQRKRPEHEPDHQTDRGELQRLPGLRRRPRCRAPGRGRPARWWLPRPRSASPTRPPAANRALRYSSSVLRCVRPRMGNAMPPECVSRSVLLR